MKINYLVCLALLIIVLVVTNEALAGGWWLWVKDERFVYPKGGQRTHTMSDWIVIDSFPTEKECRQGIKERIKQLTSPDKFGKDYEYQVIYKVSENAIHFLFFEKGAKPDESDKMREEQIMYHTCLPETADPRKSSQRK